MLQDYLAAPSSRIEQLDCLSLGEGTDRLPWNVSNQLPTYALCHITSQKNEDLNTTILLHVHLYSRTSHMLHYIWASSSSKIFSFIFQPNCYAKIITIEGSFHLFFSPIVMPKLPQLKDLFIYFSAQLLCQNYHSWRIFSFIFQPNCYAKIITIEGSFHLFFSPIVMLKLS